MNNTVKNDLIDWAKSRNCEEMIALVLFLDEAEMKGKKILLENQNKVTEGSIERMKFKYNKRYLDFDISIKLTEEKYGSYIRYILFSNIKKIAKDCFEIFTEDNGIWIIKGIE